MSTTWVVDGVNLPSTLAMAVADVDPMVRTSLSSTRATFVGTPRAAGTSKTVVVKTAPGGAVLYAGSQNVIGTTVTGVLQPIAMLNKLGTWTVQGVALPATLALAIEDADPVNKVAASSTAVTFEATHRGTPGQKMLTVKSAPGGTVLYTMSINVTGPAVTGFAPSGSVVLNKTATFKVSGTYLTAYPNLVISVADCEYMVRTSLSDTSSTFTCTPRGTAGTKAVVVKNQAGGTAVYATTVNVVSK